MYVCTCTVALYEQYKEKNVFVSQAFSGQSAMIVISGCLSTQISLATNLGLMFKVFSF